MNRRIGEANEPPLGSRGWLCPSGLNGMPGRVWKSARDSAHYAEIAANQPLS